MFVKKRVWEFRAYREFFHFAVQQRRSDLQIGDHPFLDEDSSAAFLPMLENCRRYLEYGSGGSTVLVARLNKPFVSIDTDRYFLNAVRRKIGKPAPHQHLVHGNIGWTKEWGEPAFQSPSARRRKKWKNYAETPWKYVEKELLPDLVMVDGRFRVAAALTSCVHLVNAPESRILVDDYDTRPNYHVIEEYAQLVGMAGRMAIFRPPSTCIPGIHEAIDRYSLDLR
jgi:hypothetical protein